MQFQLLEFTILVYFAAVHSHSKGWREKDNYSCQILQNNHLFFIRKTQYNAAVFSPEVNIRNLWG